MAELISFPRLYHITSLTPSLPYYTTNHPNYFIPLLYCACANEAPKDLNLSILFRSSIAIADGEWKVRLGRELCSTAAKMFASDSCWFCNVKVWC